MSTPKMFLSILCFAALSGCATCNRYPVACAIGGAVVAGSIAYTLEMNDSHHRAPGFTMNHGPQIRPGEVQ